MLGEAGYQEDECSGHWDVFTLGGISSRKGKLGGKAKAEKEGDCQVRH